MKFNKNIRVGTGLFVALLLALMTGLPRIMMFEIKGLGIASLFFLNTFFYTIAIWIAIFRYFDYSPVTKINGQQHSRWFVASASLAGGMFIMVPLMLPAIWLTEFIRPLPLFYPHVGRLLLGKSVLITLLVITLKYIYDLQEEKKRISVENERLKAENLRSELETLKQQINPHFLFNVLSSLKAVIGTDLEKAREFVVRLSELYRYILDTRKEDLIALEQEWILLNHYLFMLKARFEDNLVIDMKLTQANLSGRIPPLSLIILMENCIKHNIISKEQPLHIAVSMQEEQFLVISNTLQPRQPEQTHGTGLKNLIQRYSFFTEKQIIIEQTKTAFTVKLPIIR